MQDKLDPELVKRVKELTFNYEGLPQPGLLIAIPNPLPDSERLILVTYPEFTSLCPLASTQPDFATIELGYSPDRLVVELKSLKFYLTAFRQVPIFHETVPIRIINDIREVINPKSIGIRAVFNPRGGMFVSIEAAWDQSSQEVEVKTEYRNEGVELNG